MKKIFSALLALSLFPAVSFGVSAAEERNVDQYHTGTVVVDENFNDRQLNAAPGEEWEADTYNKDIGVYADVCTDPLDPNNKALKIVKESGGLVWIKRNFQPLNGQIVITYRAMITGFDVVHYIGYMPGLNNLMTYQGGWVYGTYTVPNSNTELNVWHEIRWEIDIDEQMYKGYIDGALCREIAFSSPLDNLTDIRFGYTGSPTWIDDLKISYTPGGTVNYTKVVVDDPEYVINHTLMGIYNIARDTEVDEVLSRITFVDGALVSLYERDGVTPYNKRFVEDFTILKVQSPDLEREKVYTLHLSSWKASVNTVKTSYKCITFFEGDSDMLVYNEKEYIDKDNHNVAPFIKDGKLYVPLRALAESLGLSVGWNAETATVTVNGVAVDCNKESLYGRTFVAAEDAARIMNKKLIANEKGIATFARDGVKFDESELSSFLIDIARRANKKEGA